MEMINWLTKLSDLFNNECELCKQKIKKEEAIYEEVKVPEFISKRTRPFCSKEHALFYKNYVKGTPSLSLCNKC